MEVKITFPDAGRIAKAIAVSGKTGAIAASMALRHEGQEAWARSMDLVPVDTGALKASGRLHPESGGVYGTGNRVFVEISYGSTAASYAIPVHENLEANHPVGQAKYLEAALNRQAVGISKRIAAKVYAAQKGTIK